MFYIPQGNKGAIGPLGDDGEKGLLGESGVNVSLASYEWVWFLR